MGNKVVSYPQGGRRMMDAVGGAPVPGGGGKEGGAPRNRDSVVRKAFLLNLECLGEWATGCATEALGSSLESCRA